MVVESLTPQAGGGSIMLEVSEEDLLLVLARSMASVDASKKGLEKQCDDLANKGKAAEMLGELVKGMPAWLDGAPASDAESGACILAHAIAKLPPGKAADDLVGKLCAAISSAKSPDLALGVFMQTFNAFAPQSKARLTTLLALLRLATSRGRQPSVVSLVRGKVDAIVKDFPGLDPEESRTLILALADVFPSGKECFAILSKYLVSFSQAEADKVAPSHPHAAAVAKRALKELFLAPDLFNLDTFACPAVRALGAKHKAFKPLYALVEVMSAPGSQVARASKLVGKGGAAHSALADIGCSEAVCMDKVRLLALASICEQAIASPSGSGDVSYAALVDALGVPATDVETWLIKAIGLKVIEGKMDQMKETFHVQRTTHKIFGAEEWVRLRHSMGDLETKVSAVCAKLEASASA